MDKRQVGRYSASAALQLTGWKRRTSEHYQWLYVKLDSHDVVRVVVHEKVDTALPQSAWAYPTEDPDSTKRAREPTQEGEEIGIAPQVPPFRLRVRTGDQCLQAESSSNSAVQATVTWHRAYGYVKVELGCVADEHDVGCPWAEARANCGESVEMEVCS
jgi:hypothetical protein